MKEKELKIASELKKYYIENYNAEKEYRILKNPETDCWLPYDIYIPFGKDLRKNGFYIEVHGEQHYGINGWHKYLAIKNNRTVLEEFEYRKKLDRMKRKFARKNGIYIEIDLRKIKTVEEAIKHIQEYL